MRIKIIRHSERLDFSNPLYWMICFGHYWSDAPLSAYGHLIANDKGKRMVKQNFNPKIIYTSPYSRTMATATELKESFPHSEMILEPLLSEYQPYYKHKVNLYPKGIPTIYNGSETNFEYPESYEKFSERIKFIINDLVNKNSEDFIIVTHSEVIKIYIDYFINQYPHLMLEANNIPYLATLSFKCDQNKMIIPNSIKIDRDDQKN